MKSPDDFGSNRGSAYPGRAFSGTGIVHSRGVSGVRAACRWRTLRGAADRAIESPSTGIG